jgi:hypothetical protein
MVETDISAGGELILLLIMIAHYTNASGMGLGKLFHSRFRFVFDSA